ncbi:peroxiredoxin family protein [Salipaludibacillus daqingensis]|uniref:peroxiredoxin family protein n=1 Tax=Salipaludibacillus daqingensis TaxID=3041001 RepID=UPI0024737AD6|nr:TlpA disulfide reductase family protein [Salipaludibacillus daqingensis]
MQQVKWSALLLILCVAGFFYLNSSHEWVVVERAMSEKEVEQSYILNDISLATVDGERIKMDRFQGKKTILFFFTSWCHVCEQQWGELQFASEEFSNMDVQVVAINLTEEESAVSAVEEYIEKIDSTDIFIALDIKGDAQKQFRVLGIPTSFYVNEKGEMVKRMDGLVPADKYIHLIKENN